MWRWWVKAGGGKGDREVRGYNNGGVGVPVRVSEGRAKKWRASSQ